jgi:DMSO/TMAO reductase YedYZ molybdopterin-dependent catalytic subunit
MRDFFQGFLAHYLADQGEDAPGQTGGMSGHRPEESSCKEIMMQHGERREALPVHPVPAEVVALDAWRLRVDGLVGQSLALSICDVEALGAQAYSADFVCEEGWMVPAQQWEGVAVAAILARAGVEPTARFLKVYAGNFTVLLPLEEALRGGALLARRLNGKPLTREHGAPLRLVAPGRACFYSVKWVDRLEVLAEEAPTTGASIARNRLQR